MSPAPTQALNIYFVNVDFPPVSGPGVWRILAFAKYAARAGHRVTVFCSDRASWHDRSDPRLLEELPSGVRIIRIPSLFLRDIAGYIARRRATARSPWAKQAWRNIDWWAQRYWPDPVAHWALKCALKAWRLARKERPDCIFTTGPQHLSHATGYLLRKRLATPWIMDYRDPWTDTLDALPASRRPYQDRLALRLEQRFLATADAVTVVSPSWLKLLSAKLPEQAEKFLLIRNGHDLAIPPGIASPAEATGTRACRLHFNGSIQPTANILGELRTAVESLIADGLPPERLRISFCGLPGSFVESIQGGPAETCYIDYGPLSHDESLKKCLAADALLLSVNGEGGPQTGVIPGKTYEAMALGKHVFGVLPRISDTRNLLEEYGNVTLSQGTTTEDIAEALRRLLASFEADGRLPRCPEDRRLALADRYARASQTVALLDLMSRLASGQADELYTCPP